MSETRDVEGLLRKMEEADDAWPVNPWEIANFLREQDAEIRRLRSELELEQHRRSLWEEACDKAEAELERKDAALRKSKGLIDDDLSFAKWEIGAGGDTRFLKGYEAGLRRAIENIDRALAPVADQTGGESE